MKNYYHNGEQIESNVFSNITSVVAFWKQFHFSPLMPRDPYEGQYDTRFRPV